MTAHLGNKRIFVWALAAALLAITATMAQPVPIIIPTTADTYIAASSPTVSHPSAPALFVIFDDAGVTTHEAYMEFVLPSGTVESATLRFMADSFLDAYVEISLVPEEVDVNTLTWNTRPPHGTVLGTATVSGGMSVIPLAPEVLPSDQPIVLRILSTMGSCEIESLESGAFIPELEVETGAGPSGRCPFDPAVRDQSNVGVIYRDKAQLFPWKVDYDTGFRPTEFPSGTSSILKFKAFFYASAGEKDIKTVGDLNASWIAGDAVPGNTVDVDVKFLGDGQKSDWTTAFGVKGGVRYKLNVEAGKYYYRKEDYVPKLPRIRALGFGCIHQKYQPPAFNAYAGICDHSIWGAANLGCFLTLPNGATVNCEDNSNLPLPTLEWGVSFTSLGEPDTTGGVLCTPGIRVHPTAKLHFCIKPSLCVGFNYDGVQLTEESTPDSTNSDNTPLTAPVFVPCDFAQARAEGDTVQYFYFTLGPFRMDANWVTSLWAKWEPAIKAKFVSALELTLGLGKAACTRILPFGDILTFTTVPLSFNKTEATFAMKIVDPEVCDIVPGDGHYVSATDSVTVRWKTTWGAPDACECRVRVDYQIRTPGTQDWGDFWLGPMHPGQDIENDGKLTWLFAHPCFEARIRVEFRDPNSQPLHELIGEPFLITPVAARIEPYKIDFGTLPTGGYTERVVTITNTDDVPMPLEIESPCPPEFMVTNNAGFHSLWPGETRKFTVRFTPTTTDTARCAINTGLCPVAVWGRSDTGSDIGDTGPKPMYALSFAYPNPFNPIATINYGIEEPGHVSLRIYDVAGRLVRTLVSEYQPAVPGGHTVVWDGTSNRGQSVASGVYFYRLVSGSFTQTRKMVLLK